MHYLDGKEVSKEEYDEAFPDKPIGMFAAIDDWHKPVVSYGLGCVPKRIKEFESFAEKNGVPTDYSTNRGLPVITSKAHQKKLLKVMKHHNNDSYD